MTVTDSTQEIAGELAQKLLRRLSFEINQVVKSCEPDRVHDLRVAIRRFNQVLRVFRPVFPGKEVRRIRRRLKQLLMLAGEVRNCDVVLALLSKSPGASSDQLRTTLEVQRKERKRELLNALKPWVQAKSSMKWRAALLAAAMRGDSGFGAKPIGEIGQSILPRVASKVFDQGHRVVDAKSARHLHDVRIATKKFRYTLELFAPLSDQSLDGLQANLKLIQARLGDINDCEAMREMLSGRHGFELFEAWLKKRQQRKTRAFRKDWEKCFGDRQALENWIGCLSNLAPEPQPAKKAVGSSATVSASPKARAAVA